MSVSSLPEWKQLLLEKKRREEEERERREKEEEEKLASMPAWKRGIIERRRAKQEGLGQWLDAETKPLSQVSVETIVPVHENPFIRTQSGWRKGRDAEKAAEGNEQEAEVVQTTESGRGTDIELKIERFRDRNEGREGERKKDKRETTVYCSDRGEKAYRGAYELNKDAHDAQMYNDIRSESLTHDVIPKFPKRIAPMGAPTGPLEIQIPRTVFYVAEDMMVERKRPGSQSDEGQECEAGRGIERRDSWRIGKPLSRVESLREKIRQKELERMRRKQRGAEEEGVSDGTEVPQRVGDRCEEGGSDMEREWEAASQMRKRLAEADGGQEGPAAQTSMNAFDVTQEVSVLKTSPQLPVSLPFSQAVRGEEVASEYTAAVSEVTSESPQISEDEDDLLKHVVEQLRRHRALQREDGSRGEGREEEEEELQSPDYFLKLPDCAPTPASSPCSPSPAQSPSVSPSPTPSPTLFSIRSASGGQVKRGATITVTPKRPAGGGAAVVSPPVVPSAAKAPAKQTPSPAAVAEPTKKRYPTVEEIEVIGGYQHLEKSCLVKGKGTPKKVRGNTLQDKQSYIQTNNFQI
uniref:Phostensin/Taperin PP1-binding domain-containing protein n=1 Tax=Myripristis murdjan TaxID=586833 RepID=A0A667XCN6_9TELE